MQYTVNKLEKGKIEVKVDVPKAGFEEAYKLVLEKLGSEVKVEGFRPGKVPSEVAEQRLGTNKLLNETASFLIQGQLSRLPKPKLRVCSWLIEGIPSRYPTSIIGVDK